MPPTLIAATADNGKRGYIYRSDLEGPAEPAASPEEAARRTRDLLDDKGQLIVPVYAADGKTRIGTFLAGWAESAQKGD
ncbi:hypothetical protein [Marmoricola sp. OAE513]|uniref:hypothetical protein n=1 Tax=Marmoricola sp. OAE513 TaxID=2817894 RepID=UPI001AE7BEB6